jgi:hypothetical protein
MAAVATGTTISFNSSIFTEVYDISLSLSRPAIPVAHMGTTVGQAYLPGKLYDWTMEVTCAYTGQAFPVLAANGAEAVDVTPPDSQGWSGNAFITDLQISTPLEGRSEARVSLRGSATCTLK